MPRCFDPSISSCVRVRSFADFATTPCPVMLMSLTLFRASTARARVPTRLRTCFPALRYRMYQMLNRLLSQKLLQSQLFSSA